MNKEKLLQVLQGNTPFSPEDAQALNALRDEFPYSQVLHVINARLSKVLDLSTHQQDLQKAAVHSADRSVLKEMITAFVATPTDVKTVDQPAIEMPAGEDVADKVLADLKKLNLLKHNFEHMLEEGIPAAEPEQEPDAPKERKLPPGRKPGNLKAHRIVELVKSLESTQEGEEDIAEKAEDIIESIKVTKKKITPESEKQKEQIELIDQFIKAQPSISPARKVAESPMPQDFNTIKSGEFGENVISETLVNILVQQGKKDRAIEVLKKLIWKFPQKKSYFAAQIEELKR